MILTLPLILDDYYESIEQDMYYLSNKQALDDCEYILGEIAIGEWWDDYSKRDVSDLKRFRTMLRNRLGAVSFNRRY